MTLDEVKLAALQLSDPERLELADALLASFDARTLLDDAWLAEVKRRSDEFDAGSAETHSWAEVMAFARQGKTHNG
jgi:putative addiction module component (TIGR02574 family)